VCASAIGAANTDARAPRRGRAVIDAAGAMARANDANECMDAFGGAASASAHASDAARIARASKKVFRRGVDGARACEIGATCYGACARDVRCDVGCAMRDGRERANARGD